MRRGALLGAACLMAVAALSCGLPWAGRSSGTSTSVSANSTAAPDAATPSTVATAAVPTPLETAPAKDILLVRSLGIDASFSETSCADRSLLTVVPAGPTIIFADCGNYWRFIASETGPLAALLSAPKGTPVEWVNGAGIHTVKVLNGSVVTVARDASTGQFAGHGVAPGPPMLFIQLRNGKQQTELTAT
jgi:hypothetical protein